MKNSTSSRRDFLKTAGAATGFLILPTGWLRGENAPSNRVNTAHVGVGGMGGGDLKGIASAGANVVALVDVDARSLANAAKRQPKARQFADYREMLDVVGKDIDAVVVSTPDHTHFTVAYSAVELGKHVYVQKPLCHTIDQVRRLTKLSIQKKVITQMGNQGQSSSHIRKGKEWYEAGLLGDVDFVEAWSDRPIWAQGFQEFPEAQKVPEFLSWDLWQGPAKRHAYNKKIAPFAWRGFFEYGCGALGDMAIHLMNDAFYVLNLTAPTKIEVSELKGKSGVAFPNASRIIFHFPANGNRGPVRVAWSDGNILPKKPAGAPAGYKVPDNGSYLHGKNFTLSLCGWGNTFEPLVDPEQRKELFAKAPAERIARVKGSHYKNWIDSITNNVQASSHFGYSGPFAEVILLGVIAQRLGRTLNWDAATGTFKDDAEANALVKATSHAKGFLA
ncbi:MAG: Gfo/Idh/MocA family oxidoreductase [Puniceicoccales bacterium]|jgi:predicted dehydrogenase|nr:Gfo/Idh/MocA family oxidoreductase [Puniceicoccales bacterium]